LVHESLHVDLVCKLLRISLAYQPPASSTFISEQTSNQSAVLFSQNKSAPARQPSATSPTNRLSSKSLHSIHQIIVFKKISFSHCD
jgi:hypothetical protein